VWFSFSMGGQQTIQRPNLVHVSQASACCWMQAQALESAVKRFSKLEDSAAEAVLAQEVHAVSGAVWYLSADCLRCFQRLGAYGRQDGGLSASTHLAGTARAPLQLQETASLA
jgi:hypothetical protein